MTDDESRELADLRQELTGDRTFKIFAGSPLFASQGGKDPLTFFTPETAPVIEGDPLPAVEPTPAVELPPADCQFMFRDGQRAIVNLNSIAGMADLGWSLEN